MFANMVKNNAAGLISDQSLASRSLLFLVFVLTKV